MSHDAPAFRVVLCMDFDLPAPGTPRFSVSTEMKPGIGVSADVMTVVAAAASAAEREWMRLSGDKVPTEHTATCAESGEPANCGCQTATSATDGGRR